MSRYTELPEVVVKPGNMISYWSTKLKLGVLILTLVLYVSCLLAIKTYYVRNKRLDHVMDMTIDTEKLINKLHSMDQKLAKKIESYCDTR